MADYRKLQVYTVAHELAVELLHATSRLPRGMRGEIGDQIRRASVSVPANIVEGCGRMREPDMLRHFRIALGSASEVEYFLFYARDTGIIPRAAAEALTDRATSVRRMVAGLIKGVEQSAEPPK